MTKENTVKKILLFTRPLAPPWDEASKNLAFDIAKNASGPFKFKVLTTSEYANHIKNKKSLSFSKIEPEPIFSTTKFGFFEKMMLIKRLFSLKMDARVVHFLFTPRKLTSLLIRLRLYFSGAKTIQTIATLPEEMFKDKSILKSSLFASILVAQSENTQKKLLDAGLANVEMIYPGINMAKFSPAPKDRKLMEQFGVKKDDFVILFAGEYTRLKAIDDIMDTFELILKEKDISESFKLILACRIKSPEDKIKKNQVLERIKKLNYEESVVMIETFADMPSLYNLSDVNIFPVREMTGKFDIPLALVEAMACKKPVIISDIPVLQEFVKHEENGFVVPKRSPEKLALSIFSLARNEEKARIIGENAHSYAMDQFDIKSTVKRYETIYRSL